MRSKKKENRDRQEPVPIFFIQNNSEPRGELLQKPPAMQVAEKALASSPPTIYKKAPLC